MRLGIEDATRTEPRHIKDKCCKYKLVTRNAKGTT